MVLSALYSWPLGISLNYFNTGRIVRGSFSYTLFMAMLIYLINQPNAG